jgi:hypothetical protein
MLISARPPLSFATRIAASEARIFKGWLSGRLFAYFNANSAARTPAWHGGDKTRGRRQRKLAQHAAARQFGHLVFSEPNFIAIVFSRRIGARASFGAIKSHLMVNQI